MRTSTKNRRHIAALGFLAVTAVALTAGCRIQMNMVLNQDDTVDGSMVMALSPEETTVLESMDMTTDDLFSQFTASVGDMGENGEVRDYNEDGMTGKEIVFSGMPLSEAGGGSTGEELSIIREGDEFVVGGTLNTSDEDFDAISGMEGGLDFTVNITFPGEVVSHNGSLSGTTVTWAVPMGGALTIEARGSAIGGGTGPIDDGTTDDGTTDDGTTDGAADDGTVDDGTTDGAADGDEASPVGTPDAMPAGGSGDSSADGGSNSTTLILLIVLGVLLAAVAAIVIISLRSASKKKREAEAAAAAAGQWTQPAAPSPWTAPQAPFAHPPAAPPAQAAPPPGMPPTQAVPPNPYNNPPPGMPPTQAVPPNPYNSPPPIP